MLYLRVFGGKVAENHPLEKVVVKGRLAQRSSQLNRRQLGAGERGA
jgi:hypothetical protein